jgi:alpha(1,3/1,4) fucosyltransferase
MNSRKPKLGFANFWRGFDPGDFFPWVAPSFFDLASAGDEVDVLVFSCFTGDKIGMPRIKPGGYLRLFYTAENVEPDFESCDYAISFAHGCDPARHIRIPNYASRLVYQGIDLRGFVHPRPDAEVEALMNAKRSFCAYIHRKAVPIRERLVRELAAYKRVDCLGPHLNNVGMVLPLEEKHSRLRQYKFTVAFENSSAPGYVTEKAIDAYVGGSVPLYWGDPEVERFLNPASMLIMNGDEKELDGFVKRVIELDEDEKMYRQKLREPLFKPEALKAHLDGSALEKFFEAVVRSVPRFKLRGGAAWAPARI